MRERTSVKTFIFQSEGERGVKVSGGGGEEAVVSESESERVGRKRLIKEKEYKKKK